MANAPIGNVKLYYEIRGAGDPVLLVPPSWWPGATWNIEVVPFLSQRYRTVAFDCRGTGRSSKPDNGYSVEQLAEDCFALMQHLEISRCHAVGFAMGSQIVQAMAIQQPEKIATLTMAASGSGAETLDGTERNMSSAAHAIETSGFESYIRSHIDNDDMAFNPSFYHEHRHVAARLADALWSGQGTPEQFQRHEHARLTWKPLQQAPAVRVPTLILCGEDDNVERRGSTPVGTARALAARTPEAELAILPGVRHMTFWDGAGGREALRDFLDRHPLGSS